MSSRHVKLGDLIVIDASTRYIESIEHIFDKYVGLVSKIQEDKWGHQRSVYISWQTKPSPGYNNQHGYCGMNIHNMRDVFRIYRNGREIK